jgi:riboflavin kinase / FMN adenylyltransferase
VFVPLLEDGGEVISRSRIHDAVFDGDVATARRLLGRPFSVSGTVMRGETGLGIIRTIGLVQPDTGAYAAHLWLPDDKAARPAVVRTDKLVAVYEPWTLTVEPASSAGDLCGQTVRVDFLDRINEASQPVHSDTLAA